MLRFSTTSHSITNENIIIIIIIKQTITRDFDAKKKSSIERESFVDDTHETFRDTCRGGKVERNKV